MPDQRAFGTAFSMMYGAMRKATTDLWEGLILRARGDSTNGLDRHPVVGAS